jgi:hypothetical protein
MHELSIVMGIVELEMGMEELGILTTRLIELR